MKLLKETSKPFVMATGGFALLLLVLAFTDVPYYAYHNLGTRCESLRQTPDVIVVLGGSGMPSADGLIRTYYAADAATKHLEAAIIIAHPKGKKGKTYQLDLMATELIIRGINPKRITYEPNGHNTRTQAVNVAAIINDRKQKPAVLIITTPEHMYRSIRAFKKTGIENIGGLPSFEQPISEIKLLGKKDSEEAGLALRYNMWSYLKYELLVLREYCAIVYYGAKGWI